MAEIKTIIATAGASLLTATLAWFYNRDKLKSESENINIKTLREWQSMAQELTDQVKELMEDIKTLRQENSELKMNIQQLRIENNKLHLEVHQLRQLLNTK